MPATGADSVLLGKLREAITEEDRKCASVTNSHLTTFAKEGLRTLLIARRVVEHEEFDAWRARLAQAEAVENLSERNKTVWRQHRWVGV